MKRSYIFAFIISIIFIVLVYIFQDWLVQLKSLGLLGIFLINLIGNATVFLPAPAIASVVAGGIIYSPLAVAFSSALGASLGDMVGFLLGKSGKELFIKNHHAWYVFLKDLFKRYSDVVILLFAFVPNPFFDVVGILAGVFTISPYRFFILLFIGRLVRDIILAYTGSKL